MDSRELMPESTSTRSRKHILATSAAAAVLMFLALYFPDRDDGAGAMFGGIFALFAVALGLAAVSRTRPLPRRSAHEHALLAGLALGLGVALGIANLSVNYGMAALGPNPRSYQQMVETWAQVSSWSVVFAEPMIEEIGFRLLLMGGIAWMVARFTDNHRRAFQVALTVSAFLFGLAHILYGEPLGPLHAAVVTVKSGAAGLLLGWVFCGGACRSRFSAMEWRMRLICFWHLHLFNPLVHCRGSSRKTLSVPRRDHASVRCYERVGHPCRTSAFHPSGHFRERRLPTRCGRLHDDSAGSPAFAFRPMSGRRSATYREPASLNDAAPAAR